MQTKRNSEGLSFPLPLLTNQKWWEPFQVNDVFKKGNTFRMFAGASCDSKVIPGDNKKDIVKPTDKTSTETGKKKSLSTKKGKKSSKK